MLFLNLRLYGEAQPPTLKSVIWISEAVLTCVGPYRVKLYVLVVTKQLCSIDDTRVLRIVFYKIKPGLYLPLPLIFRTKFIVDHSQKIILTLTLFPGTVRKVQETWLLLHQTRPGKGTILSFSFWSVKWTTDLQTQGSKLLPTKKEDIYKILMGHYQNCIWSCNHQLKFRISRMWNCNFVPKRDEFKNIICSKFELMFFNIFVVKCCIFYESITKNTVATAYFETDVVLNNTITTIYLRIDH